MADPIRVTSGIVIRNKEYNSPTVYAFKSDYGGMTIGFYDNEESNKKITFKYSQEDLLRAIGYNYPIVLYSYENKKVVLNKWDVEDILILSKLYYKTQPNPIIIEKEKKIFSLLHRMAEGDSPIYLHDLANIVYHNYMNEAIMYELVHICPAMVNFINDGLLDDTLIDSLISRLPLTFSNLPDKYKTEKRLFMAMDYIDNNYDWMGTGKVGVFNRFYNSLDEKNSIIARLYR